MIAENRSWMDLVVASHVKRLPWPFSFNLYANFSACFLVPISRSVAQKFSNPFILNRFWKSKLKW
jgi:hypothetical protein